MGRQGEGAGPRSFPHPRRAAPGRTAVAIAPVHANAPTQDFVWRLVSARCRRTGQPAIAVDVLASTHAFRPPSQPSCPAQIREAVSDETLGRVVARRNRRRRGRQGPGGAGVCYDQRRVVEKALGGLRSGKGGREALGGAAVWQSGKKGLGDQALGSQRSVTIRGGWPIRLWAAGLPTAIDAGMADRARGCARPKASQADGQTSGAGAGQGRRRPRSPARAKSQLTRPSGGSGQASAMILGGAQNRALAPEQPARPPPTLVEDGRCCRWDGAVELGPPPGGRPAVEVGRRSGRFSSAPLARATGGGIASRRRRSRGLWLPERLSSARRAVRSSGSPSAPAAR